MDATDQKKVFFQLDNLKFILFAIGADGIRSKKILMVRNPCMTG